MSMLTVTLPDWWEGSPTLSNAGLMFTDADVGYARTEFVGSREAFVSAIAALQEVQALAKGSEKRSITSAITRLRAQL